MSTTRKVANISKIAAKFYETERRDSNESAFVDQWWALERRRVAVEERYARLRGKYLSLGERYHEEKRAFLSLLRSTIVSLKNLPALVPSAGERRDCPSKSPLWPGTAEILSDVEARDSAGADEESAKFDVFLSHNFKQKDWVRELASELREFGLCVFFDEDCIRPGEDILRAIESALESARHIVLVLSEEAVKSPWVALEWYSSAFADPNAEKRRVIPLVRSRCDIPFLLRRIKYLDARDQTAHTIASRLRHVLDIGHVEQHGRIA